MARTVAIGKQSFEDIVSKKLFYVDKTLFIKEWWENEDDVTLITRPRRFGKTLNMNMLERFFSLKYVDQGAIFEGLSIWKEEKYRQIQGTYPVVSLSFASIKSVTFQEAKKDICFAIEREFNQHGYLLEGNLLNEKEKRFMHMVSADMEGYVASASLSVLSEYLCRYYGKKVIILLDEYDTPMQEAYLHGYWNEMMDFIRNLFHAAFKTNPYLERAIMTGVTRTSKESIFSDLNNLEVVTATSEKYQDVFGFTQQEVSDALSEYGLSEKEERVKDWYDGFTFGKKTHIYNPWSIVNYLEKQVFSAYWANTSSNDLAGKLIREGSREIKIAMEELLKGGTFWTELDEQVVFSQLDEKEEAVWSLLLTSGYLKIEQYVIDEIEGNQTYELALTNYEVYMMFKNLVKGWFGRPSFYAYNQFIRALLQGDLETMNHYMNRIALQSFSYFDTGKGSSEETGPECFYHGFVLGLIVELTGRYLITSNRESGFGRYDIMLEPKNREDDAVILEFKTQDTVKEKNFLIR